MRHNQVDECVEILCQKGCQSVREDIRRLEAGVVLPEVAMLDDLTRRKVLQELRSIMAVYGDTCPLDLASEVIKQRQNNGAKS
jgi:hypothetical protein